MYGFNLTSVSNVTIQNVNVMGFGYGIYLQSSILNSILENNITFNEGNIYLGNSSDNTITGNTITDGAEAIQLYASSNNTISDNSMMHNSRGVWLRSGSTENVIHGNNITDNGEGISVDNSSNNSIVENNITRNMIMGIRLLSNSRYNTVTRNNIDNNHDGIKVQESNYNTVVGNNITRNSDYGVFLFAYIHDNTFYHNNFLGNTYHVGTYIPSVHVWDNGYPSGGNYWSNYTGVDLGHDGIGDTEYVINENNTDNLPLMGMFHSFNAPPEYYVNVISNSTVEDFQYFESNSTIKMYVSNMTANQTHGFCRVSIPYEVMSEPFNVTIDGANPTYWNYTLYDNGTHRWIYFEYEHTTREIVIVSEFPSFLILPLFMIATLLAVIVYKRKHQTWNKKREVWLCCFFL
jgi:parallel beta-helix repeat protein